MLILKLGRTRNRRKFLKQVIDIQLKWYLYICIYTNILYDYTTHTLIYKTYQLNNVYQIWWDWILLTSSLISSMSFLFILSKDLFINLRWKKSINADSLRKIVPLRIWRTKTVSTRIQSNHQSSEAYSHHQCLLQAHDELILRSTLNPVGYCLSKRSFNCSAHLWAKGLQSTRPIFFRDSPNNVEGISCKV